MVSGVRLLRALERSGSAHGCTPVLTLAATRDWASALFVGARYEVTAELEHGDAAEAWLAGLPQAELAMPRQFAHSVRVISHKGTERLTALMEVVVLEE